jgi:hypothetical protein
MGGAKKLKVLAGAFVVLVLLNSCSDFFSTSWGELFKRDPKNVKVTSSNVYDLLDAAKGNMELSRAILDQIGANSSDALKIAAIKAANQAAGIPTLALENVNTLLDAVDTKNYEEALRKVADSIQGAVKSNDIVGISEKLTVILEDKYKLAADSRTKLINTRAFTVAVPKANGNGSATVNIDVDKNGAGFITVIIDGAPTIYPCVINDDGTITLKNAGSKGQEEDIQYVIDDDGHIILRGLDHIADKGLAGGASEPSAEKVPPGKPEFESEFLDASSDSDLTLMVITLILAKAEKERAKNNGTLDTYFDTWMEKNMETGNGLEDDEMLIAATVNGMISRGELSDDVSELTKMLKDLLKVNN